MTRIQLDDLACAERSALNRLARWIGVPNPDGWPTKQLVREVHRRLRARRGNP